MKKRNKASILVLDETDIEKAIEQYVKDWCIHNNRKFNDVAAMVFTDKTAAAIII